MGDVTEFRPRKPPSIDGLIIHKGQPPQAIIPERGAPEMIVTGAQAARLLRAAADDLEGRAKELVAIVVVAHFEDEDEMPMLVSPACMSQVEVAHTLTVMASDVLSNALDEAVRP